MEVERHSAQLTCLVRGYGRWIVLSACLALLVAKAVAPYAAAADPGCRPRLFGGLFSRCENCPPVAEVGGTWYWMRSEQEEKRAVAALYNRYCIRCHGVDGRGVWDIPDVPNFTNGRWQAYRSDGRLAEIILQGRGAVMPPFRGTLSLEEACAVARYLRTFVPGTEISPPDYTEPKGSKAPAKQSGVPGGPSDITWGSSSASRPIAR
jgi:cytochrome c553